MRQNLAWAAAYNLAAIPLAAMGWIPPWLAAIGMSVSSILVVLNARRIATRSAELPAVAEPGTHEAIA
jgi:Cu2+-exporting ATPase